GCILSMSVSGLPSAAPVSRESRIGKSEKSNALVLLSIEPIDSMTGTVLFLLVDAINSMFARSA
ncbi:hypothetical protein, partial [Microcoleus sp. herbarium12]|uniref:hypothetical protein n=1 Tax=Microcoleus sp. herbarium12 TaxID=3055437 RepID=UPI002FD52575